MFENLEWIISKLESIISRFIAMSSHVNGRVRWILSLIYWWCVVRLITLLCNYSKHFFIRFSSIFNLQQVLCLSLMIVLQNNGPAHVLIWFISTIMIVFHAMISLRIRVEIEFNHSYFFPRQIIVNIISHKFTSHVFKLASICWLILKFVIFSMKDFFIWLKIIFLN